MPLALLFIEPAGSSPANPKLYSALCPLSLTGRDRGSQSCSKLNKIRSFSFRQKFSQRLKMRSV